MALTCDRCTKVVKSFMMSRFNTECICKECIASEKLHPDYQKAVEAERASNKYMQALFISEHIGQQFEGKISGLASFGLFVILDDNYCEGMVSLRSMDDDHYAYRKEDNVVYGTRHGEEYRLGDRVKVKVAAADPLSRQIDFYLL